ncbi:MAG: NADH-quinone oxidoreductase subunit K [Bacteroidota bacterium]
MIKALCAQGCLIGMFALWREGDPDPGGLVLIVLEAFLLKAAVLPYMMYRTVKRHGLKREMEPWRTNFQIVLATFALIAGSLFAANLMHGAAPRLSLPILGAALASMAIGLLLVIVRQKLITHVLGYLVLENGIYLLSLSMHSEMPLLIHLGVLLDVFAGVFFMNLLLHRIISTFDDLDVLNLRELRDE